MTAIIDAKTHPKSLVNFPGSRNTQMHHKRGKFLQSRVSAALGDEENGIIISLLTRCYFKVPPWGWP